MSSVRSPSGGPRPGPGSLLSPTERYIVCENLAEGGMGALLRGRRVGVGGFEKEVVLKQLLPEFASDPEITGLFLREAQLSAMLDHQNIVHTLDLVQVAGTYYIVMEYVRGADLRTLLRRARRRGRQFSPEAALLIGRALLDALDYAHGKVLPDGTPLGLIHRDISPSNILLSAAGEVKLTDFGIAKVVTHASTRYQVRGKVGYMSPEQVRGERLDLRSDLFSLAVVLYEVLCGCRLFVGDLTQSPAAIYAAAIVPPSHRRPGLPPELDRVMARALALDPGQRYQSARELQAAFAEVVQRHGLLIGHADLAGQLRELCGPDPDTWRRDEDRTGTARIEAGELLEDESPIEEIAAPEPPTPSGSAAAPGAGLLGAGGLRVGETTSLLWVTQPMSRIEAPDTTQPVPRQPAPHLGIAAMARKMVQDEPTAQREAPDGDGRGDDTRALGRARPGATRRVFIVAEREAGAAGRALRLSWRGGLVVAVAALLLLGLGVLLGLLLSAAPDGEGRGFQGRAAGIYCGPPSARRAEAAQDDSARPQRHERLGRVAGVHPTASRGRLPRHQGA